MKQTARVNNEATRERFINHWKAVDLTDKDYDIAWAEHKPTKTDEQRAYFHGIVVRTLAQHMGYGEYELKQTLVQMFTTPTEVTVQGEVFTVWPSTERLKRPEYSNLIDRSLQFAAEGGIFIP